MDLKEWRNGINLSIKNSIELYNNGAFLIKKGSCGHATFLFITALEEIAVAYFIMDRFETPEPNELMEFLKHDKKYALSNFMSIPLNFARNIYFQEKFIKSVKKHLQKEIDEGNSPMDEKIYHQLGTEIKNLANLWYLRNRGIYITLNESKTQFISPKDISKEKASEIANFVSLQILQVRLQRDHIFKFGIESELLKKKSLEIFNLLEEYYALLKILNKQNISQLKKYKGLKPADKDYIIDLIINPKKVNLEDFNLLTNILKLLLAPLSAKLNELLTHENFSEHFVFFLERLKHYNNLLGTYTISSVQLLKKIGTESFNLEDYRKTIPKSLNEEQDKKKLDRGNS